MDGVTPEFKLLEEIKYDDFQDQYVDLYRRYKQYSNKDTKDMDYVSFAMLDDLELMYRIDVYVNNNDRDNIRKVLYIIDKRVW